MRKFYNLLFILFLPALFLLFTSEVLYHTGSPGGKTGSPGDGGANCTDCHTSFAPVDEEFWIYSPVMQLTGYNPGETYDIIVIGMWENAQKFGFEATAEDAQGNKVGQFIASFDGRTQTINNNSAITHTAAGNAPIIDTTTLWNFTWTAPATSVGEITFYAAINSANGNGNNQGDLIHLSNFTAPVSTGIGESEMAEKLEIYPNPGNGDFTIQANASVNTNEISVFNTSGQLVYKTPITAGANKLDLKHLEKGIYFVKAGDLSRRILIR
ncbi:MAG: T9SS type A sorting domain-containing protein [Bacteroidales bacterium]|nr:T9SS type A sorting domain-containing protein [Bacteroidales bacterium]